MRCWGVAQSLTEGIARAVPFGGAASALAAPLIRDAIGVPVV
ncbi:MULTISPECIES: hypothetical protein [Cupriavidus]|nr:MULTISPECIES: hypothetical protein [Cupriavidus]